MMIARLNGVTTIFPPWMDPQCMATTTKVTTKKVGQIAGFASGLPLCECLCLYHVIYFNASPSFHSLLNFDGDRKLGEALQLFTTLSSLLVIMKLYICIYI